MNIISRNLDKELLDFVRKKVVNSMRPQNGNEQSKITSWTFIGHSHMRRIIKYSTQCSWCKLFFRALLTFKYCVAHKHRAQLYTILKREWKPRRWQKSLKKHFAHNHASYWKNILSHLKECLYRGTVNSIITQRDCMTDKFWIAAPYVDFFIVRRC